MFSISTTETPSRRLQTESARRDLGDVLWVAFPKILGGLLQLSFNVILLRFLGPKSFGMLSVCLAAVVLGDSIFGSAIDMSIFRLAPLYRVQNPETALQIQKVGLLIKPAGALFAIVPLAVFAPRLSEVLFQTRQGVPLLYLTLAALLGCLLIRSTQVHFQIERRFRLYGMTDLVNNGFCFGTLGALLLLGVSSPFALLAVYAVIPVSVSLAILATRARPMALAPAGVEARRALLGTLKWFLLTVIVGSVLSRMDLFFVSSFAGINEAGIYSAAQVFALVPALMGLYMSAVFSPRVMPLWQQGKLRPVYLRYQVGLIAIALIGYIVALLLLRPFMALLLPQSFQRSTDVVLALLPAGLCAFLSFPWTIPLLLYLRPRLLLAIDCAAVLVVTPLYITSARHSGAIGVAMLTSGLMAVRALIHQWLAWRTLAVRPGKKQGSGQGLLEQEPSLVRTA